jgi:hypothetical protein
VRYAWRAGAVLGMGWYVWQILVLLGRGPWWGGSRKRARAWIGAASGGGRKTQCVLVVSLWSCTRKPRKLRVGNVFSRWREQGACHSRGRTLVPHMRVNKERVVSTDRARALCPSKPRIERTAGQRRGRQRRKEEGKDGTFRGCVIYLVPQHSPNPEHGRVLLYASYEPRVHLGQHIPQRTLARCPARD